MSGHWLRMYRISIGSNPIRSRSDGSIRYIYSVLGMNRPLIVTWRCKLQTNETEEERYRMMTFHVLLDLTNCLAYHYSRSSFNESSRSMGDCQLGPSSSNRTRMTVYKEIIHTNTVQVWSPQRELTTCKSFFFRLEEVSNLYASPRLFNPLERLASNFSSQYHPWIKYWGHMNRENDHQWKQLLIVIQILLVGTLVNVKRTVWRICILMLGCKGFIGLTKLENFTKPQYFSS